MREESTTVDVHQSKLPSPPASLLPASSLPASSPLPPCPPPSLSLQVGAAEQAALALVLRTEAVRRQLVAAGAQYRTFFSWLLMVMRRWGWCICMGLEAVGLEVMVVLGCLRRWWVVGVAFAGELLQQPWPAGRQRDERGGVRKQEGQAQR